jgi:hypothetical protein
MNPLPRVTGSDDDTLLPEEIIRNLSILTPDYDQAGLAPAYGTVGDYSMLDGETFVDDNGQQVAPVRKQSCSQVLIRKSNGKYWPFVDGVKSQSNNTATIASYRGENVHVTLRQTSDESSTQEYNTVYGFRGETSSQRMIGPLAICVVVEEGQTPPEEIEVHIWQNTVVSGVSKPRTLNGVVKLNASELAQDGDIKCLTLPFPATFMRPPFVEIRDTDNEKKIQVANYAKAPKRLFYSLFTLLVKNIFDPSKYRSWTAAFSMNSIAQVTYIALGIAYNTTTGLFTRVAWNNDDFSKNMLIHLICVLFTISGCNLLADVLYNLTPDDVFALTTNLDTYEPIARGDVTAAEVLASGGVLREHKAFKVPIVVMSEKKAEAQVKLATNLTNTALTALVTSSDRTSRVRFTIPQLADTLSQIAVKGGPGMVWQFDDSKIPKRERVLRRFLNTPDSRWSKLKMNEIFKGSKDKDIKNEYVILHSRIAPPTTHYHALVPLIKQTICLPCCAEEMIG